MLIITTCFPPSVLLRLDVRANGEGSDTQVFGLVAAPCRNGEAEPSHKPQKKNSLLFRVSLYINLNSEWSLSIIMTSLPIQYDTERLICSGLLHVTGLDVSVIIRIVDYCMYCTM